MKKMNIKSSKNILPATVFGLIIVLSVFTAMCTTVSAATGEEINQAIDNGSAWLKAQDTTTMSIGQKGLVAYALLHAGVPETEIQSLIDDVAASTSTDSYILATQILALVSTENLTHSVTINWAVSNLTANQYGTGGWGYGSAELSGADNSHTHVALLALYTAAKAGYTVPAATWTQAASYLETEQQTDGGWEYYEGGGDPGWTPSHHGSYGSMTAAGVMGLEMCGDMGAPLTPGSVSAGIDWLATNYTFNLAAPSTCSNPGANGLNFLGETWMHYFMWTVEEAMGVPTEKVYLTHSSGSPSYDWYYDGADFLVDSQIPATPLQGYWSNPNESYPYSGMVSDLDVTCFAILFLEKVTAQHLTDKTLDPEEGSLGTEVTVTIDVNAKQGETVTVVDTLPPEFTYIVGTFKVDGAPADPTVTKTLPPPPRTQVISYTIYNPGPGTKTYTIEFDAKVTKAYWDERTVENVVVGTWNDEDGVVIETKEATAEFTIFAFEELWKEAAGPLTIPVNTETQWQLVISVTNPFDYTMKNTVITDRFGAEIEIDEPFPDEITQGTASWDYGPGKKKPNKSKKVFLTWTVGNLLPGETAELTLWVSTDLNPAGKQEYSSPSPPDDPYEMNSGATLKFIDPEQDMQLSAVTDSIYVTVEED